MSAEKMQLMAAAHYDNYHTVLALSKLCMRRWPALGSRGADCRAAAIISHTAQPYYHGVAGLTPYSHKVITHWECE